MATTTLPALTLEWAVQTVGCPSCRVPAGEPCRTPGGRLAPCHSKRYERAKRARVEAHKLAAWNRQCQA